MTRRYNENSLSNIQQLLYPWGYVIFLKHVTTLQKHLTNMQNLILYNTKLEFYYIMANVTLPHVCFITFNHLDPRVEK